MYIFFRITCGVKAKKVVDMRPYFANAQYRLLQENEYWSGFIRACVYENKAVASGEISEN